MRLQDLIDGIRPKTLVAGIIPPICAHALYTFNTGESSYYYLIHCLGLAICIQIATNFYNDAVDFKKGADDFRVGPRRIAGISKNSYKTTLYLGHFFIFIAFIAGVPLVLKGGVVFAILGFLSLYLSYGYTGGPYPLAYLGLGEIFVFLFFGLLATLGSYYLYAETITFSSILLGAQLGLLSCILIAVNNLRDKKTDVLVGKNTLATKMSEYKFLKLIDLFIFVPYLILFYLMVTIKISLIFPLLSISFGHRCRDILRSYNDPSELNQALKLSGIQLLTFGFLLIIGLRW